ncbi:hypothetical protein, partial [Streptomyces sp. NPDC004976]
MLTSRHRGGTSWVTGTHTDRTTITTTDTTTTTSRRRPCPPPSTPDQQGPAVAVLHHERDPHPVGGHPDRPHPAR